jgi:hypothetical protein
MTRITGAMLVAASLGTFALAATPLATENVSTARADIKVWNVKATSAVREGSTTSTEQGRIDVTHRSGKTTSHDAKLRVQSGTLFQDGEVCHNFGPKCYCGTTTFRLESGASLWKFGTPSNNQPVDCPAGVRPTGDPEIKKAMSKGELDALKKKILAERAAKRKP